MDDEFPEKWTDFVCSARSSLEECRRNLAYNISQNVILREKMAYLESVCRWIEEEQVRLVQERKS